MEAPKRRDGNLQCLRYETTVLFGVRSRKSIYNVQNLVSGSKVSQSDGDYANEPSTRCALIGWTTARAKKAVLCLA